MIGSNPVISAMIAGFDLMERSSLIISTILIPESMCELVELQGYRQLTNFQQQNQQNGCAYSLQQHKPDQDLCIGPAEILPHVIV